MGVHKNIGYDQFPKQGSFLGFRAIVHFNYDLSKDGIMGTIVRDDAEDPGRTVILLDDGRVVLATECHFSPQEHFRFTQMQEPFFALDKNPSASYP